MQIWTVGSTLSWIEGYLAQHGIANARLSAQWLLSDVLDCSRIQLYADLDRPLSLSERELLRGYTKRRAAGEPLQYITGTTDFRFLSFAVEPGVLIPRPETEVLVSEALSDLRLDVREGSSPLLAVDLCTGSGNVACSLAWELPQAYVFATDISPSACSLAQRNVDLLGLGERVVVLQGDLGEPFPEDHYGMASLVISNPPYIPSATLAMLDSEVVDYEPVLALDGGVDGLDVFRRILPFAQTALKPGGLLAVELFEDSIESAQELAAQAGFFDLRIACDLAGRPRVLLGRKVL